MARPCCPLVGFLVDPHVLCFDPVACRWLLTWSCCQTSDTNVGTCSTCQQCFPAKCKCRRVPLTFHLQFLGHLVIGIACSVCAAKPFPLNSSVGAQKRSAWSARTSADITLFSCYASYHQGRAFFTCLVFQCHTELGHWNALYGCLAPCAWLPAAGFGTQVFSLPSDRVHGWALVHLTK